MLLAINSSDYVTLLFLHLTAAFDTVDLKALISYLEQWVGIRGTALEWFRSYLAAQSWALFCSLPAAWLHTNEAQDNYHCYVDDSRIYVTLKKKDAYSITALVKCLNNIKEWMALNFLSFNEKKTDVMVFGDTLKHPFQIWAL